MSTYSVPVSVLHFRGKTMNMINKVLSLLKVFRVRKLMMNKHKKINEVIIERNKYSEEKKVVISSLTGSNRSVDFYLSYHFFLSLLYLK